MTHRVIKFYEETFPDGTLDFRGLILSKNGSVYSQQRVIYANGGMEEWCACVGWRTRFAKNREKSSLYGTCSHFVVFEQAIETNFKGDNLMQTHLVPTNVNAFNKVFGGIPLGLAINLYGEPQSSKTTTSMWMGFGRMKDTGKNLLVVDVEKGIADHLLPKLLASYNKENKTDFGIKHMKIDFRKWKKQPSSIVPYKDYEVTEGFEGKKVNVVVVDIANFKEMSVFVGMPHEMNFGKRISLTPYNFELFANGDIWDSPIGRLIDDPNSEDEYCGFIFDSLTYLMKVFGIEQQSFPPRDTAQSIIINQLNELLHNYDEMFGVVITHGSRPPADSNAVSIPVGGKAVGHGFKYAGRMHIDKAQSTDLNTVIVLEPYRLPSGSLVAGQKIAINNKGVF